MYNWSIIVDKLTSPEINDCLDEQLNLPDDKENKTPDTDTVDTMDSSCKKCLLIHKGSL